MAEPPPETTGFVVVIQAERSPVIAAILTAAVRRPRRAQMLGWRRSDPSALGMTPAPAVPMARLTFLAFAPANDAFPVRCLALGAVIGVAAGSPMVSGFSCRLRLFSR